jgi:hypothetical protein
MGNSFTDHSIPRSLIESEMYSDLCKSIRQEHAYVAERNIEVERKISAQCTAKTL